jgi:hypothetical protein
MAGAAVTLTHRAVRTGAVCFTAAGRADFNQAVVEGTTATEAATEVRFQAHLGRLEATGTRGRARILRGRTAAQVSATGTQVAAG